MGIFGALTTAVGGMRAQAFALKYIPGHNAKPQTNRVHKSHRQIEQPTDRTANKGSKNRAVITIELTAKTQKYKSDSITRKHNCIWKGPCI